MPFLIISHKPPGGIFFPFYFGMPLSPEMQSRNLFCFAKIESNNKNKNNPKRTPDISDYFYLETLNYYSYLMLSFLVEVDNGINYGYSKNESVCSRKPPRGYSSILNQNDFSFYSVSLFNFAFKNSTNAETVSDIFSPRLVTYPNRTCPSSPSENLNTFSLS